MNYLALQALILSSFSQVLRVIDSSSHVLDEMKSTNVPHLRQKRKYDHKQDKVLGYKEKISLVIPYIGISLINFHAQVYKIEVST